ncbi:DUF4157 domain-containing protein [Saccharopolyspora indica]|uniref:eCIS core domain-containing protein n=1 Tax=Saccharopolyspora indica TaxID=1229659 RepID=UPI0022EA9CD6|nr:DUF4157 domain-containing protein [Saccharopolyspora indica]MDA3643898.1 DUF4157 domain-containing protein [Saccharopolyspora indica]
MSSPVPAHRSRSSQDAKRRKRKDRKPKNRAPEPKEIVSGAGQPLDHSTRRELEERLGHDFSRVRLHTDREAGELADMLGADAVAIGQDILFSPGKFRPGTADGERLLAHELLHTVQNPNGLGALRAGRDLGAVSLPQQAIEREAESGARERNPEVRAAQTPGWLRYAKVDADRTRMEVVDPATFVDRLVNGLVRSLRGDPEDRSKRTRKQLARMSPELRESVLDRLESRLLSSEQERVLDLVEEIEADDNVERSALSAPEVEPDAEADLRLERETQQQESADQQEHEDEPAQAAGPDKEQGEAPGADGSTPENAGPAEPGAGETESAGQDPEAPESEESEQTGESASEDKSEERSGPGEKGAEEKSGAGAEKGEKEGGPGEKKGESGEKEDSDGKKDEAGGEAKDGAEQEQDEQKAEEKKEQPGTAEPLPDKEEKPQDNGSPKVAGKAEPQPGAVSELEGTRNQDAEGPQEKPVSPPAGGDSEVEVGGGEESAWDVKLQPEDFLPEEDLDVSGVPTADKAEPGASGSGAMPSFPAPPPTKADQVQAERDAEDAEDEAAEAEPEEETGPPLESDPAVETEGGPGAASLADLATEKATDPGSAKGKQPADPKAAEDQEKGPAEAQRTAQDAAGKAEGDKDAAGGAVKESAAKQEKEKPGEGGREKKESGEKKDSADKGGESGKQEQGKGPEAGQQDKDGEQGQDKSGGESGAQDKTDSGAPGDSKDSGGQGEQPGGGESSKPTEESGKSEPESPKPQAEAPPKPTEEPARTESPSPKAPAPKSKAPKPEAPQKAEEPTRPEKQEAAAESAPSKSGPAPAAPRGGGRGSTGGGGAKPAPKGKKSQAVPNLAQASPEAGLRTASGLKPHQAMKAMNGVNSAADRSVGDEHKKLSSAPPAMQRPSGAPQTLDGEPKADAPADYSTSPAEKADAPEKKDAEVKDQKKPEGKIPAEEVEEPDGWDTFLMGLGYVVGTVASWFDSDVKPEDLAAKFAGMPTQDEALKEAQAGTAPGVEMKGDAGEKSREQNESVDTKGEETAETGRDDTERRMGEDQVYPKAPKEELRGKVPERERGKGGGPDGGANTGAVPEEAASEVAEHERGKEFKSSFSKGEQSLAEAKRKKEADSQKSKEKHRQSVDREVQKNTKEQSGQRQTTLDDVTGERQRWRDDQDAELKKLGTKKSEKREQAEKDVDKQEKDTDKKAEERKEEDNGKIRQKGRDAEGEAKTKRNETENQAGNWVEKAFEYIKQKFIELRDKIIEILRNAREKIIEFVENFKFDIEALINEIRETIIGLIKKLVEELVELAKALVQAIIDLANEIRKFITDLIEAAIALVTKLAEALKQLIKDLLEAIAKLLNDILSILKKALEAMVQAVKDAIKAVLDFASKLLSGLGQFMMIAADFLSDPGGWLSGAKSSAEDGAKNHFFREVKNAVKTWFQQKIEEIIGLPKEIINKLIKGGLTLEWIVKQVWDAVVPQLPLILGEVLITKVIAKLIPGAGWVMAVIDAIKTAIGALGEILRAFGAVLTWLRSVRKGGAGVLFAKAVAAGVVALLELAYEFLLSGIGKYVGKVGSRLKDIAKRMATKGRKKKPGQGADDEDPRPGGRPGQRKDTPGPRNTRPGEGSRGPDRPNARPGTNRRNERPGRRNDQRRNDTGRRDNGRDEKDRERQDDRVSPSSAARQAANKPGGKPGPDRDAPKPDRNHRGRTESDQDRRRREDNDRDRPDKDPKDRDQRPDKDNPDSRDRKPTDRDDSPSAKDKDGNPKGKKDEDKPDTKPTPSAKPKPKPKADPPRKPREDTDTKKDQKKDDDKQKPKGDDTGTKKDDKDTTNRKGDDSDSTRRRDEDGSQRKDKDDDSNKRKDDKKDKDGPGKRKDDGGRRDKHKDSGSDSRKPKRKDDKNSPQAKKEKKKKRKEEEESEQSKDDQLARIVARIRPKLYRVMSRGVRQSLFNELLTTLRVRYRLTSLRPIGGDPFTVMATLNPSRPVIPGEYTEPNSERDVYSIPPGEPKPKDVVQEEWTGRAQKGQWYTGEITRVIRRGGHQHSFDFYGHGPKGKNEFRVPIKDVNTRWEKKYFNPKVFKIGQEFENIRHRNLWSEYNNARQTLNYRMTAGFTNPDNPISYSKEGKPLKPQWHHIIEQRLNGPHHMLNLVLTSANANQDFNTWMDKEQPRGNPRKTSKHYLPSTNGKPVHQFLAGAGFREKMDWSIRCMEEVLGKNPLPLKKEDQGRGPFLKLS